MPRARPIDTNSLLVATRSINIERLKGLFLEPNLEKLKITIMLPMEALDFISWE